MKDGVEVHVYLEKYIWVSANFIISQEKQDSPLKKRRMLLLQKSDRSFQY